MVMKWIFRQKDKVAKSGLANNGFYTTSIEIKCAMLQLPMGSSEFIGHRAFAHKSRGTFISLHTKALSFQHIVMCRIEWNLSACSLRGLCVSQLVSSDELTWCHYGFNTHEFIYYLMAHEHRVFPILKSSLTRRFDLSMKIFWHATSVNRLISVKCMTHSQWKRVDSIEILRVFNSA